MKVNGDSDAGWIGDHLRLLDLPEGVQRYIAEGAIPVDGERLLRDIAKVSPGIAECICEMVTRSGRLTDSTARVEWTKAQRDVGHIQRELAQGSDLAVERAIETLLDIDT